jgi:multidrug transporter EmrE-like cation transporter
MQICKRPGIELLRAVRRLERECVRAGLPVRFPVPDDQCTKWRGRVPCGRCRAATLILPWPSRAAAPFIAASALIHIVYFLLVGRLYRNADLSVAYPIMRGLAPLIAAVIALATLGEAPGPVAALGIVVLVGGVLLMGASGLAHGRVDAATIAIALANSLVIASTLPLVVSRSRFASSMRNVCRYAMGRTPVAALKRRANVLRLSLECSVIASTGLVVV